ncbi:MAG TPA: oxaloacetate decarboxylase subunit alpha [Cycloclasticus sp.]|jgi:oxaloacetate decarboxylase alpha subunit|nr:oxaloacetate decarboxylase subunit alpha [Cycloclasticus sp.]HIL92472.1 oxaloacetate decarboxylase subunit alpha [Cycloclasticus sp.]
MTNPLKITDVVLRDAHQSLFATRLRIEDMLPIAEKLDKIGYWSLETWGGATFDSCIRYLGEDPWERLRLLKAAMPNTQQQMLLRGQNLLGYRHYADDVVRKFVERAAENGMDVFRIFDAMNDVRNLETAIKATIEVGKHAQGTISYTQSPVHTLEGWVDMGKKLEDAGCHSIAIKDMAGLLRPYDAAELVKRLKAECDVPIALHCHATTGMSVATCLKAVDAGLDMLDTAISSMSMTYGHSPTETFIAMLEGTERATGLDIEAVEEIAAYFREVRPKYAEFEGSLKGVDSRILIAQVPGGMLTNLESQLKQQNAGDKIDEVLAEIPIVRKDLGYLPLVTPTSQIVGTQAVMNVLMGERYKSISKETAGVLKGEYGETPAAVDAELQTRVLDGAEAITCRPADLIDDELDVLITDLEAKAKEGGLQLAEQSIDDVLTYALFPQVGLDFIKNRHNPDAFEPVPTGLKTVSAADAGPETYDVEVKGKVYSVTVGASGSIDNIAPAGNAAPSLSSIPAQSAPSGVFCQNDPLLSPMAGNIIRIGVAAGDDVHEGDVVIILEAMKMETEIRAHIEGQISDVFVKEGESIPAGAPLILIC